MNARELTIYVNKMSNEIIDINKELDFLKQELEKIRRMISDVQIDLKMIEYNKRK